MAHPAAPVRPAPQPASAATAELIALVTRAQRGDVAAQSDLVRHYAVRIAAFVRSMFHQPSAVEDIVQIVFVKMVRKLSYLRDPRLFESWLFTLARNSTYDFLRRSQCRIGTVSTEEEDCEDAPDPSQSDAMAEIMEVLELALARLNPEQRKLVALISQGHSHRFIASRLGISAGAVKVRLHRLRRVLRRRAAEFSKLRIFVGKPRRLAA